MRSEGPPFFSGAAKIVWRAGDTTFAENRGNLLRWNTSVTGGLRGGVSSGAFLPGAMEEICI